VLLLALKTTEKPECGKSVASWTISVLLSDSCEFSKTPDACGEGRVLASKR
jgi:hypothetical protein